MKKIIASIFIISVLASCSASKESATTEKPEAPAAPVKSGSPRNPNNFPVK